MTHLRQRSPGVKPVSYLSIGVRGEEAARTVEDARAYAQAQGVTFGSLVMQALVDYMDQAHLEAQMFATETNDRE